MSEVLRAILDKNCTYSAPAFYSAVVALQTVTAAAVADGIRTATVQCKTDTWFLLQGAAQVGFMNDARTPAFHVWGKTRPTTFQIQRGSNQEVFSNFPQIKANQNFNLNNFVTLDEYILFAPAELIVVNMGIRIADTVAPYAISQYVAMMGIEYKMPSGKGTPNYGY